MMFFVNVFDMFLFFSYLNDHLSNWLCITLFNLYTNVLESKLVFCQYLDIVKIIDEKV